MSDVISANIEVHTSLAKLYNEVEPHFRPENQRKVSSRLEDMSTRVGGGHLLDLGCGTGFIINLARNYFSSISGVDVTPAMIEQVDIAGHDISLYTGRVESLPFDQGSFDALTAYSFLDHIEEPALMLREASRVMRSGAEFYIDLVPNRFYWTALKEEKHYNEIECMPFVIREYTMVSENDKRIENEFGIDAATFRAAEPAKEGDGVNPFEFRKLALDCGFESCEINFDWFLGNARVFHEQGEQRAAEVQSYLVDALPISKNLFKYVWFVLRKA